MNNYRLLVCGLSNNNGGIETTIQNYCRILLKTGCQIDFLVHCDTIANENELINLGCNVFKTVAPRDNFLKYRREINHILKSKKYDIIWDNRDSLANIYLLFTAKNIGIPIRIVHGHTMTNLGGSVKGLLHQLIKNIFIKHIANRYWAVSQASARYFYSENILRSRYFNIIPNCIDFNEYKFDAKIRETWRKKNKIARKIVLVVGRLQYPKNQELIIRCLTYLQNKNTNLILAGDGADTQKLQFLAKEMGVGDMCYFLGMVGKKEIINLLMASDVFVMPSFNEGLPLAYLEAQAAGLPCVISHVIPKEADISYDIVRLSPLDTPQNWAKAIDKMLLNKKRNKLTEKHTVFSLESKEIYLMNIIEGK